MKTEIVYSNKATKNLNNLNQSVAQRIVKKIKFYSEKNNLSIYATKLKPSSAGLFRFRIGDYRVIFEIDNKGNLTILTILTIKHRKDIYN
ncbi:MAG: type II toxin-antitoxin system RelE/ParE family toxin [Patescibacteria group bacterium]